MDAKMRTNFINTVSTGEKIPCPSCNSLNDSDSNFCIICGSKMTRKFSMDDRTEEKPAFETIKDVQYFENVDSNCENKSKFNVSFNFVQQDDDKTEENVSIFADGLPDWDILPPQLVVRRKNKK